jgi:hypothetical protein
MTALASRVQRRETAKLSETVPPRTVSPSRAPDAAPRVPATAVAGRISSLLPPRVQAETRVSQPEDAAEREAVATARKVMRMAAPPSARAPAAARPGPNASTLLRAPLVRAHALATVQRQPAAARPRPPATTAAAAAATGTPDVMPELRAEMAGGAPLPPDLRAFMEPRFKAGFGAVRVHTGEKAANLARRLAARAFTYGKHIFFGAGEYRPHDRGGMQLIAHELTHTIQQKEVVQREIVQRQEDTTVAERAQPHVQRLGLSDALNFFADAANAIPGFRMFTIILGTNPINMSRVDRSAANILRAIVEFIPGGNLITRALDTYNVFERVGAWVEGEISRLGLTGASIKRSIDEFLDSLSWSDIFDLGGVWNRARRIFTDPIGRLIDLARSLITGVLRFLREAVLRPLAALAQGTAGYDL